MNFALKLHDMVKKQNRPLYVMAPMADVTDMPFRSMFSKFGSPDIYWTEFVSADGLIRATSEGKYKLMKDLIFDKEKQKPIIAQLFSSTPEHMYLSVKLCIELGFDGVDINMGCPDKSIEKQGCGAGMIKSPEKAKSIIQIAKKAKDESVVSDHFTISVKTRVGYNKPEIDTWIKTILEQNIDILTIHARTRKEMSKVPANWDYVKQIVNMRNDMGLKTLIFGNGDIDTLKQAYTKYEETKVDGIMIGRGLFGNPWFFKDKDICEDYKANREERIKALIEHIYLFEKYLLDTKSFAVMKKFFKTYLSGFDDGKNIRDEIMNMNDIHEVIEFLKSKL